jgi:hypothetical protein
MAYLGIAWNGRAWARLPWHGWTWARLPWHGWTWARLPSAGLHEHEKSKTIFEKLGILHNGSYTT